MKKTLFFMLILAVIATGCKKKSADEKSTALNYGGSRSIVLALLDTVALPASSDYDITVTSSNPSVIRPYYKNVIIAKNVGNATLNISNGNESVDVDVRVDLFIEPTFEFGCNSSRIRELYGNPALSKYIQDTILVYAYTKNNGYSYSCGEMDFLFDHGAYYTSYVFVRTYQHPTLLNRYLDERFNLINSYQDTTMTNYSNKYCQQHGITNHDTVFTRYIYSKKLNETIICGRQPAFNDWNETFLFYFQIDPEENSDAILLNRRPRSSKFLY